MKRILFTIIFLLVTQTAWAATYTVCATGCDEQTIQAVFDNNNLSGPDTIYLTENITESGITWGADDGGDSNDYVLLTCSPGVVINGNGVQDDIIDTNSVDYIKISENCKFTNWAGDIGGDAHEAAIFVNGSQYYEISQVEIYTPTNTQGPGIILYGDSDNGLVTQNLIYDGFMGVEIYSDGVDTVNNTTITSNTIHTMYKGSPSSADGIVIKLVGGVSRDASGLVIDQNNIYNCADQAVDIIGGYNVTLQYNRLYDSYNGVGGDENLVKLANTGVANPGLVIKGNVIYNADEVCIIGEDWQGVFENNTVVGCGDNNFNVGGGVAGSKTIRNNIFSNCAVDGVATQACINYTVAEINIIDNNVYGTSGANLLRVQGINYATAEAFATYQALRSPNDSLSVAADPLFISTTDFRLRANSPARKAGTGTKFNGQSADIGAYQTVPGFLGSSFFYSPGYPLGSTKNEVTIP